MTFSPLSHSRRLLLIFIVGISGSVDFRAKADLVPLDTRGPVQNAGMVVKVDEEGVQTSGFHWKKPPVRVKWTAKMIRYAGPREAGTVGNLFRKEIVLKQEPKRVVAWLSSIDDTYRDYMIYINGRLAGRGPSEEGFDPNGIHTNRLMYDYRDFTPLFHKGKNAIAVEQCEKNGFLFEADVEYPDGTHELIVSDESWKSLACPYLKKGKIPEEDRAILGSDDKTDFIGFDAEKEPVGWQQVGFNDASWPAAGLGGFPQNRKPYLSELPPLMEALYPYFDISRVHGGVHVPENPLKAGHPIVVTSDGEFAVHFKRIMAGRCGIKVKGGKGSTLYLQMCETDGPGGHESSGTGRNKAYPLFLRDGIQYFESRAYYGLGTVNVIARHVTGPIEIMEISADSVSQPVTYQGSFECSDPFLNALWKSSRWSTQMCMMTHHLDSPSQQEGLFDYGDYLVQDMVNYYTMGDNLWLARQDLRKEACLLDNSKNKTFITTYILYWLQSLLNYYEFTGDSDLVKELAPTVYSVIDTFSSYIGRNGLVCDAPSYFFFDWAGVTDDKNPKIHTHLSGGPAVAGQGTMTALFYRALADAMRVSKLTHEEERFQKYEKLRAQVAESYQRELWNESKGLYRDGKPFVTTVSPHPTAVIDGFRYRELPPDLEMESFSIQNNSIAVLHGLTPADRESAVLEKIIQNPTTDVTTYYMHYVFDAIAHAGLFDKYGVPLLHSWKIVPGTQTTRESAPIRIGIHQQDDGDGKNDYTQWTPGLERMFAPTHPIKSWF